MVYNGSVKKLIPYQILLFLLIFPSKVGAHIGSHFYEIDNASKWARITDQVVGWILNLTMAAGILLVGGAVYYYLTAKEKEENNQKANTYLTYAIIVLLAGVVVGGLNIIAQRFIF